MTDEMIMEKDTWKLKSPPKGKQHLLTGKKALTKCLKRA